MGRLLFVSCLLAVLYAPGNAFLPPAPFIGRTASSSSGALLRPGKNKEVCVDDDDNNDDKRVIIADANDESKTIQEALMKDSIGSDESTEALARSLQMVLNCEKAMGMDEVFVRAALERDPANAVKFLVACDESDDPDLLKVGEIAMDAIRSEPELLLRANASSSLPFLSPQRVEALLQDDEMQATEHAKFRIIQSWLKSARGSKNRDGAVTSDILEKKARDMMRNVALQGMNALATEVRTSGLITETQLLQACIAQFDRAPEPIWKNQQEKNSRGKIKRSERVGLDELGILASLAYEDDPEGGWISDSVRIGEAMAQGKKYKWSFYVKECNSNGNRDMYLGIACDTVEPTESLGSSIVAWALSNNGVPFYRGSSWKDRDANSRSFQKGSTVSFELDLTDVSEDVLCVSVDGGPWKVLFHVSDDVTYRPAASVRGGDAVEFLGFDD